MEYQPGRCWISPAYPDRAAGAKLTPSDDRIHERLSARGEQVPRRRALVAVSLARCVIARPAGKLPELRDELPSPRHPANDANDPKLPFAK
jgi:hypothetical protein